MENWFLTILKAEPASDLRDGEVINEPTTLEEGIARLSDLGYWSEGKSVKGLFTLVIAGMLMDVSVDPSEKRGCFDASVSRQPKDAEKLLSAREEAALAEADGSHSIQ